jgi:hypothetical protein
MNVHHRITRKSFFSKLGAIAGSFTLLGCINSSKNSPNTSRMIRKNAQLLSRFKQSSTSVKTNTLS